MALMTDQRRKWFLVIIMSVLMVSFAIPTMSGRGRDHHADTVVGTVLGEPLKQSEFALARSEWETLSEIQVPLLQGSPGPLTARLFLSGQEPNQLAIQLAQMGLQTIGRDPGLYALLKREALKAGVVPSSDRVEAILANNVRLPPGSDRRLLDQYRGMIASFLSVEALAQQTAAAVKVTRPELRGRMARQLQSLTVSAVPFEAEEFRKSVPAPSEDAVRDLFRAHSSKPAGDADYQINPYGFGYRQADRVRLDYIALQRAELVRAARAARTQYDWDVEANKYYLKNQSQFTADVPPATAPSNDFTLGGTTKPASTQRIQRPFTEVRETIVAILVDQRADALRDQVLRRLTQILSADYRAYADAVAKKTTTQPSSVGVAIDSPEYLKAVAAKIQQETGVTPEVTTFGNRYFDAATLAKEDIGSLTVSGGAAQSATLAEFVLSHAKPFFDAPGARKEPGAVALELFEPTPAFTGSGGSDKYAALIARVTDAQPARTPQFEEVVAQVREDAIRRAAVDAAAKAAGDLAGGSPSSSLAELAATRGRRVIVIPTLREESSLPPEFATLNANSKAALISAAFDLLRTDPSVERPRTVVPLPRDGKVVLLELTSVRPLIPDAESARLELAVLNELRANDTTMFLANYFNSESIVQRTKFVKTDVEKPTTR